MTEAVLAWRQHPTEAEDACLIKGQDIMDWHRGVMSSRRLLVILRHAPDDSAYKLAAQSSTGWPESTAIMAQIHEDVAWFVASKRAAADETSDYQTFIPPKDRLPQFLAKIEEQQEVEEGRENLFTEGLGFT